MKTMTSAEYKQCILEVLLKIDRICRENGLDYFIISGTLLGAVRHKGFIPWDDDVDIMMPRADYAKLGQILLSHPEYGLNYIDIDARTDSIYFGAKVCDARTGIIESNFRPIEGYGAFVDVFAMDHVAGDPAERERLRKKYLRMQRLVQHASKIRPGRSASPKRQLLLVLAFLLTRLYEPSKVLRRMTDRIKQDNERLSDAFIGVPWEETFYPREILEGRCELEFENHFVSAPAQWDAVLTALYGKDYMTPIPPDERDSHGLICYWRD